MYSLDTIGCVFRNCWRHERLDFPLNISLYNNLISSLFWTSNGFDFMKICTYVSKVRTYINHHIQNLNTLPPTFCQLSQCFYWLMVSRTLENWQMVFCYPDCFDQLRIVSSDREIFLKFQAEDREFATILRSVEQFV